MRLCFVSVCVLCVYVYSVSMCTLCLCVLFVYVLFCLSHCVSGLIYLALCSYLFVGVHTFHSLSLTGIDVDYTGASSVDFWSCLCFLLFVGLSLSTDGYQGIAALLRRQEAAGEEGSLKLQIQVVSSRSCIAVADSLNFTVQSPLCHNGYYVEV